jgi:PAS domain S-box-containing protein
LRTDEQLRESERKFAAVFELAPFPIVLLKWPSRQILDVNSEFMRLYGYAREEVVGKTSAEVGWYQDLSDRARLYDAFERDGALRGFRTAIVTRSGERRFVSNSMDLIDAGGEKFVLVTLKDITEKLRAREQLSTERNRLMAIVMNSPSTLNLKDVSGRYLIANPNYELQLGLSPERMIGRTDAEIFPFDTAAVLRANDEQVMRSGGKITLEETLPTREGELRTYISHKFPIFGPGGELDSICSISLDITEKKRAEEALRESEARFRQLADFLPQIVWTARPDGFIDYYNARWYEFTGFSRDPGTFVSGLNLMPAEDRARTTRAWDEAIRTGNPFEVEYRYWDRTEGRTRWFMGRAVPIRDASGRITKWFGTSIDVDDLKRVQGELSQSISIRDDFLSIASHELKTPLTSLLLQAQGMRRRIDMGDLNAITPERVSRFVDQTERDVHRLTRLVNDMLDISRIRAGKLSIDAHDVDLCEIAREVSERLGPQILSSTGSEPILELCERAPGRWDPVRIEQVLINLLTNAMKYGKGKPIRVRVERLAGSARFSVQDQGPGIAPKDQARIFGRFERAISASEVSGLGLGLFISQQIVESHDGRIWVESELGRGACFLVELPYRIRAG